MRLPSLPPLACFPAYALGAAGIGIAAWIRHAFGETDLDQILWHLQYLEPAGLRMGSLFLFEFVFEALLFPLAFAVLAALLHGMLRDAARPWQRGVLAAMPWLAGLAAVAALLQQFSVYAYVAARLEPDRFATNYVEPRKVPLSAGTRRNLVLIYAESLEQTYGDSALFGRDLLADTRRLGGFSIPSYRGAEGADWTIAAIVATQCGVPLRAYTETDVRRRSAGKSFLPGATCLGDILQAHGYTNVFLGGVPLSFAGKGSFLRDHGYTERWGRDEWEREGAVRAEFNAWGLYDDRLYERARARLERLQAAGQPFNLTLLTLDTHNPHGFLSPYCRSIGARDFDGIVSCASRQIADFVAFMEKRGYLENTTVVVLGDHLAKPNPAYDKLQHAGEARRIFNLFIAHPQPRVARPEVLPFDLYPTLVEMLGIQVEGRRLGLGSSAFADVETRPLQELSEDASLAALRSSGTYEALWQAPAESGADANSPD